MYKLIIPGGSLAETRCSVNWSESRAMLKIYYTLFDKALFDSSFTQQLALLPKPMGEKAMRFRRWQDAYASLLGKLLLKKVIDHFGADLSLDQLQYSVYQRPYFPEATFDFNISHSGGCVVCAAGKNVRVGIDVEEIAPINIFDFRTQFHDDEWRHISESAVSLEVFYEYWTGKEALIKADGRGLNLHLNTINLRRQSDRVRINESEWSLKKIAIKDAYKCTVATSQPVHAFAIEFVNFNAHCVPV